MIFPTNAIVFNTKISGNTTLNIVEAVSNYDVYVLSVTMQQEKDLSDTEIICNSDSIALNYGKDFPQMFTNYNCNSQTLYIAKSGNDEAFVSIVYSTSTPIYPETSIEGIDYINGFSYGDIIIGFFVMMMFLFMLFSGMWNSIIGVKQKRSHANIYQFNSAEGKGNYLD